MKLRSIYNDRGFTLVEVIISFSIFLLISYFGVVFTHRSLQTSVLDSQVAHFYYTLLKARSRALTNSNGIAHGVYVSSSTYTLFQGNAYDSEEKTNEHTHFNQNIRLAGMDEIVFSPLSGNANSSGSIRFLFQSVSTTITVFENGQIIF